jgi:hydroxymethylbilane synthase
VEVRRDDGDTLSLLLGIEHHDTRRAVTAERAFLEALGGGCQVPVGAYARCELETMVLTVFLGSPDGARVFRTKAQGRASNPHEVALDAYQRLIERGAGALLHESRT